MVDVDVDCCEALARCKINKLDAMILLHGDNITKLGILSKDTCIAIQDLRAEVSKLAKCNDLVERKILKIKIGLMEFMVNRLMKLDEIKIESLMETVNEGSIK